MSGARTHSLCTPLLFGQLGTAWSGSRQRGRFQLVYLLKGSGGSGIHRARLAPAAVRQLQFGRTPPQERPHGSAP